MARSIQEEWMNKLKRVIRREVIQKNLLEGNDWQTAKREAQNLEKNNRLNKATEELLKSEFVVNPKRAEVALNLSTELQRRFSQVKNLAIVILGSGAHGGAVVRDLTQNTEDSDFDWGVVCDNEAALTSFDWKDIADFAAIRVPDLGKKAGLGDHFESCEVFNARQMHSRNFTSDDDCFNYMLTLIAQNYSIILPSDDPLNLSFYPSFPADVNENNRKFVLSALKKLHMQDHQSWLAMVEAIIDVYGSSHALKDKHLVAYGVNNKTVAMASDVEWDSKPLMIRPFRALLESTGI